MSYFSMRLTPFPVYNAFCNILSIFLCEFEFQHCFGPKHILMFFHVYEICFVQTGEQFHYFMFSKHIKVIEFY